MLGPFQSKAFGTSSGPWVVSREVLEPFHVPAPTRVKPVLPYLEEATPSTISRSNNKYMYYSSALRLVHPASLGCAMDTGDLLGFRTISGPTPDSFGSLIELTWNGRDMLEIAGGTRTFLEDGDKADVAGWYDGCSRIGFGTCSGKILPAVNFGG